MALWAQHTQALEKFALNSSRGERRTTVSVPNTTPKWMDVWMVVRARKRHCTDENYDYFEYTHSGTHFSKIDLKCVRNYAFMLLFLFVSFGKYLCNRRSAIIRSRWCKIAIFPRHCQHNTHNIRFGGFRLISPISNGVWSICNVFQLQGAMLECCRTAFEIIVQYVLVFFRQSFTHSLFNLSARHSIRHNFIKNKCIDFVGWWVIIIVLLRCPLISFRCRRVEFDTRTESLATASADIYCIHATQFR